MALTLAVAALFLVSPRVPRGTERANFVRVIDIAGPVRLNVNCDSASFVGLAHRPELLLLPGQVWQSRPGYPAIGWLLSQYIRPLGLDRPAARLLGMPIHAAEFTAFVLLNWALLTASVVVMSRALGGRSLLDPALMLPAVVLSCNGVVKAFFWTPHLQIFNIFVPTASVALNYCLLSWGRGQPLRRFAVIGFILGLGTLVYGAFLVAMVSVLLCLWYGGGEASPAGTLHRRAAGSLVLAAAFCLPLTAWIGFVLLRNGSFYSHETAAYRQFVWMYDALRGGWGAFAGRLGANLAAFLRTVPSAAAFPALLLLLAACASRAAGVPRRSDRAERIEAAAVLYLAACLPFYALLGHYSARLTWSVVPPLLYLLSIRLGEFLGALGGSRRNAAAALLYALMAAYVSYWVLSVGPYA